MSKKLVDSATGIAQCSILQSRVSTVRLTLHIPTDSRVDMFTGAILYCIVRIVVVSAGISYWKGSVSRIRLHP